MEKQYFVYILASENNGTLYVGITNNLVVRAYQHRNKFFGSKFTSKYGVKKLVYYEMFDNVLEAIKREKVIKKWNRDWKLKIVGKLNPDWDDLFDEL